MRCRTARAVSKSWPAPRAWKPCRDRSERLHEACGQAEQTRYRRMIFFESRARLLSRQLLRRQEVGRRTRSLPGTSAGLGLRRRARRAAARGKRGIALPKRKQLEGRTAAWGAASCDREQADACRDGRGQRPPAAPNRPHRPDARAPGPHAANMKHRRQADEQGSPARCPWSPPPSMAGRSEPQHQTRPGVCTTRAAETSSASRARGEAIRKQRERDQHARERAP